MEVKARMPGLILSVNVKEGDAVKSRDVLGTLEAMKMEQPIPAPQDGTVTAVNEALLDDPSLLFDADEEKSWICRFANIDIDEVNDMMNEDAYFRYLRKLGKV